MLELRPYVDSNKKNAFRDWFLSLDSSVQARVDVALTRLEMGSRAAKGVGEGVMELRLDFGPGYRIYFGFDRTELVILLGGGTKRRQSREIEVAKLLWREYKRRKAEK